MFAVAVAWFLSDGAAIRCVLPVLLMTSCLQTICQAHTVVMKVSCQKITGGSRAMSAVYDSLARRGLVQVDVTSTQIESPDGSTGPAGKV